MSRPHSQPPAQDVICVEDEFYISAASSLADDRTRVLKQADTFAVFDRYGDVQPLGLGEQGLYHAGTRYINRLELRLKDARPLLLSSTIREEDRLMTVDLTNPDVTIDAHVSVPRDMLHIFRSAFLWQGRCYTRFLIRNYALEALEVDFAIRFEADFADIFEVRGAKRPRRGQRLPSEVAGNQVVLRYKGLDGVVRRTELACEPAPQELSETEIRFVAPLQPKEGAVFDLTITCMADVPLAPVLTYDNPTTSPESIPLTRYFS